MTMAEQRVASLTLSFPSQKQLYESFDIFHVIAGFDVITNN